MGLPRKVATLNEVYMAIYDIGGNSDMNHILNLNLITLTLKSIWDVYVTQMQHHCKTNPTPLPKLAKMVQHKLPQAYKSYLINEIMQLTYHHNTLQVHNPYKDGRQAMLEREKVVHRKHKFNRRRLKPDEITAYADLWVKTSIVAINGRHPAAVLEISPIPIWVGSPLDGAP